MDMTASGLKWAFVGGLAMTPASGFSEAMSGPTGAGVLGLNPLSSHIRVRR